MLHSPGRIWGVSSRAKATSGETVLEFENAVDVDRPIDEVFAFLSDFENIPKWNYYVLEVRQLSESPIGKLGHRVREDLPRRE